MFTYNVHGLLLHYSCFCLQKSYQYTREEARNLADSMALRIHDTMSVPPGHTPYKVSY